MAAKNKIIYADKLQKAIVDDVSIKGRAFAAVMRHIQEASAVEVVHGSWVKQVEDDCYWYECSECAGVVPRTRHGHDWYSDYCPNCGAKMDGDGNG